jgi:hypothetical protein
MAEEAEDKNTQRTKRQEVDADQVIRDYIESDDRTSVDESDQPDAEVGLQEQALHDTKEPPEAVLTGGDIDAAWDQASVGDETVGGSSPTPDQDIVDEIGEALGVTYQDTEPLHTTEKLAQRDAERWELNPASSEDFAERSREINPPKRPQKPQRSSKANRKKAA